MAKYIQYPFSPNIPWRLDDGVIIPKISTDIFSRIKKNAKSFNVICPGYLLESLFVAMSKDTFLNKDIKIKKWIMPSCYSDGLKLFKFKNSSTKSGDMFSEYRRIKKAVDSYISPIFMDADENVYFNLLFNYGNRVTSTNAKAKPNTKPFWKQILDNTCFSNDYRINFFDFTLNNECKGILSNNGINPSKRFLLIDNSNLFGTVSSGLTIKNTLFFPDKIRNIAGYLYKNDIQCVVMTGNRKNYFGNNVFTLDSWNNINSLDLLSILNSAHGVISSDPNIYMSAAIMGCKKILCNADVTPGWSFGDLEGLCPVHNNWVNINDPSIDSIVDIFGREEF